MQLRVLSDHEFTNLQLIRQVLESFPGEEIAEFTHGTGAGHLCWKAELKDHIHSVRISIPLAWLTDPRKAADLEATTRYFAVGVRAALNSHERGSR